jgi:hypothetical protein
MLIEYQAILIDRVTQIVLGSNSNIDLVKIVSSSIFDTFVVCLSNDAIPAKLIDLDFKKINGVNLKYTGGASFSVIEEPIDPESIKKQKLFLLRKLAVSKLLDRIEITKTSFDYMSDMNIDDILLYENFKNDFVNLYSSIRHCSTDDAQKHLDLINQSNKTMVLKKYDLLWRYTPTLNQIIDKTSLEKWIEKFHQETVTAYRI